MQRSSKRARAMRPSEILPSWYNLQQSERLFDQAEVEKAQKLSDEPIEFFRQIVGFEPTFYQVDFIKKFLKNQFIAACWCRQSGKSWIISALLLWYSLTHKDSYIAVVGPSWRQTKLVIRRIAFFVRRLPPGMAFKPLKTKIDFTNGSVIEAFPCNPDTIRGPTLHVVYCDEMNFLPDDREMYDAILFTLGTTDGKFVCSSTPWNTDSIFWKIFNHKDFSDFAKSHVSWEQAREPKGPLKNNIIKKIRKQFGEDQARWRREMEAEWAEDQDVWLPQSLIVSCIGTEKNCGYDLQPLDPDKSYNSYNSYNGSLFAGLDLAQVRDYTVFSVVERLNDVLFLRHLKIFSQPTKYAHVMGYIKTLQDRWNGFEKIRVDFTREGPSIIEDMKNARIDNAEGVAFTIPRKSEMAILLRQRMSNQKFFYPHLVWNKPYESDLCSELNVEKYQLRKDGAILLNHPSGTHDDVFWSIALAVYATVDMKALDLEAFKFG